MDTLEKTQLLDKLEALAIYLYEKREAAESKEKKEFLNTLMNLVWDMILPF